MDDLQILESQRRDALYSRNALRYKNIVDLLGISLQNIEDWMLYEQGVEQEYLEELRAQKEFESTLYEHGVEENVRALPRERKARPRKQSMRDILKEPERIRLFLEYRTMDLEVENPFSQTDPKRKFLRGYGYTVLWGEGKVKIPLDQCAPETIGKVFKERYHALEKLCEEKGYLR